LFILVGYFLIGYSFILVNHEWGINKYAVKQINKN
jgi:hypothetical protein